MGLSNAERQRRFRQRRNADPQKRERYLKSGKERYKDDCKRGKIKPVSQMTDREKRAARKKWRNQKRKDRVRMKLATETLNKMYTPPLSPESPPKRQEKRHRKKKRREEAKSYRERRKMQGEIETLKRKLNMYKKRLTRMKSTNEKMPDTPRQKTRRLLRHFSKKEVKRSLFSYQVLVHALKEKYKEKRKSDKADFAKILCNQTLKKYRLKTEVYKLIGKQNSKESKKMGYNSLTKRIADRVHAFYTRNDNSRLIAGKRQTKTYKKLRKQRRILLSNLKTLHLKFLSEGKTKISYSAFCKLRPFYVVFPRQSDRNTCMCKTCNNTELLVEGLVNAKATQSCDINSYLEEIVCSTNDHKCMQGECEKCKDRTIEVNKGVLNNDTTWYQWRTKQELRKITKQKKVIEKPVYVTIKECFEGTVDQLLDRFHDQLKVYQKHIFRTNTQYEYYAMRKNTLKDNECIMHIDFSENYVCGYNEEIQSVHFGASKQQLSLQTGVVYLKGRCPETFCTVSESLSHGPEGVWGHLIPVLNEIKTHNPHISSIEFFSDGPVTQYRQKGNFYLASTKGKDCGFEHVKWSFFEAGHGKGVPDAIGGAIKRQADNSVKYGHSITSAKTFCESIPKESKVKMYMVTKESIDQLKSTLDAVALKAVPGTLNLHQVVCEIIDGRIAYRHLSCHCTAEYEHDSHEFETAEIYEKVREKTDSNERKPQNNDKPDRVKLMTANQTDATNDIILVKEECIKITKEQTKEMTLKTLKSKVEAKRTAARKRKPTQKAPNKGAKKMRLKNTNYKMVLRNLSKCQTFDELKQNVSEIPEIIFQNNAEETCLAKNDIYIDYDALKDIPNDLITTTHKDLFPVEVHSDGNCLPSCGSVYAFGTPNESEEIRARIVKELVTQEDVYLNNEYLESGLSNKTDCCKTSLKSQYAQYSEYYIPGMKLDENTIRDIYRKEIFSVTINKSYMGIWQLFALANVLNCAIYSVYPNKGNETVRNDLNRCILPRQPSKSRAVYIMWTNTRADITTEHWVPNHFVPLVPYNTADDLTTMNGESRNKQDNERNEGTEITSMSNTEKGTNIESKMTNEETDNKQNMTMKRQNVEGEEYTECELTNEDEDITQNITVKTRNIESVVQTECEITNQDDDSKVKQSMTKLYHTIESSVHTESEMTNEDKNKDNKQNMTILNPNSENVVQTECEITNEEDDNNENKQNVAIINPNIESSVHTESEMTNEDDNQDNNQNMTIINPNIERAVRTESEMTNEEDDNIDNKQNLKIISPNIENAFLNECEITNEEDDNNDNRHNMTITNPNIESSVHAESEITNEDDNQDNNQNMTIINPTLESAVLTESEMTNDEDDSIDNKQNLEIINPNIENAFLTECQITNEEDDNNYNRQNMTITNPNIESSVHAESEITNEDDNQDNNQNMTIINSNIESAVHTEYETHNKDTWTGQDVTMAKPILERGDTDSNGETKISEANARDKTNGDPICDTHLDGIKHYLDKHVIVNYNGRPYPGFVQDVDDTEVEILCMHQAGKKGSNRFYWPQKLKDESKYNYSDIISVIPAPAPIPGTRHYSVDEELWQNALRVLK